MVSGRSATSNEVAVVAGGGTMGCGIAQALLEAGAEVILKEVDDSRAGAARVQVAAALGRRFKDQADRDELVAERLARFEATSAWEWDRVPSLAIEAVPENPEIKAGVLAALEREGDAETLIATNTSSLSISALASALCDPARFIGMHFFNPVPRSTLIELVVGAATAPEAVERARGWVTKLDKECIVVRDSPGFATSRLGVALGLEAIRMLEEEVASAADIDAGMVLGYKFPIGPLRLTDLVGLDVRLSIADHLARQLGPRFEAPQLLRDLVAAGHLGQKTGQGFYTW